VSFISEQIRMAKLQQAHQRRARSMTARTNQRMLCQP
jgi:hypothetical protein